jgi:hypothetical protein
VDLVLCSTCAQAVQLSAHLCTAHTEHYLNYSKHTTHLLYSTQSQSRLRHWLEEHSQPATTQCVHSFCLPLACTPTRPLSIPSALSPASCASNVRQRVFYHAPMHNTPDTLLSLPSTFEPCSVISPELPQIAFVVRCERAPGGQGSEQSASPACAPHLLRHSSLPQPQRSIAHAV